MIEREYLKLNTSINTASNSQDLLKDENGNIEAKISLVLPANLVGNTSSSSPKKIDSIALQTSKFRLSLENTPIAQMPLDTDKKTDSLVPSKCQLDVYPYALLDNSELRPEVGNRDMSFPDYKNHLVTYTITINNNVIQEYVFQANTQNNGFPESSVFYPLFKEIGILNLGDHIMNICAQSNHEAFHVENDELYIHNIGTIEQMLQDGIENAITYASTSSNSKFIIDFYTLDYSGDHPPLTDYHIDYNGDIYYAGYRFVPNGDSSDDSHVSCSLVKACKPSVRIGEQSLTISYDTAAFDDTIPIFWNTPFVNTYDTPEQLTIDHCRKDVWNMPPPKRVYKYGVTTDSSGVYNFILDHDMNCAVMNLIANQSLRDTMSFLPWIKMDLKNIPGVISNQKKYVNYRDLITINKYNTETIDQQPVFTPGTFQYGTDSERSYFTQRNTFNTIENVQFRRRTWYYENISAQDIATKPDDVKTVVNEGLRRFEYNAEHDTSLESFNKNTSAWCYCVYNSNSHNYSSLIKLKKREDDPSRYDYKTDDPVTEMEITLSYTTTDIPEIISSIQSSESTTTKNLETYQSNIQHLETSIIETGSAERGYAPQTLNKLFMYSSINDYGAFLKVPNYHIVNGDNHIKTYTTSVNHTRYINPERGAIFLPFIYYQNGTDTSDYVSNRYCYEDTQGIYTIRVYNIVQILKDFGEFIEDYYVERRASARETESDGSQTTIENAYRITDTFYLSEHSDTHDIVNNEITYFPNLDMVNNNFYILDGTSAEITIGPQEPVIKSLEVKYEYDTKIDTSYSVYSERTRVEKQYGTPGVNDLNSTTYHFAGCTGSQNATYYADGTLYPVPTQNFEPTVEGVTNDAHYIYLLDLTITNTSTSDFTIYPPVLKYGDEPTTLQTDVLEKGFIRDSNVPAFVPVQTPEQYPPTITKYGKYISSVNTLNLNDLIDVKTLEQKQFISNTPISSVPTSITQTGAAAFMIYNQNSENIDKYEMLYYIFGNDGTDHTCLRNSQGIDILPIHGYTVTETDDVDTNIERKWNYRCYLLKTDLDSDESNGFESLVNSYNTNSYRDVISTPTETTYINAVPPITKYQNNEYEGNLRITYIWNNLPMVVMSPIQSIVLTLNGVQITHEIQPVNMQQPSGSSLVTTIPIVENFYSLAQTLRDLHDELVVTKESFDDSATYTLGLQAGQERTLTFSAKYITKDGALHQIYIPPNGVFTLQLTFGISYYIS